MAPNSSKPADQNAELLAESLQRKADFRRRARHLSYLEKIERVERLRRRAAELIALRPAGRKR